MQNTDEYRVLKQMVESGEVTPAAWPQDVKAMRPEFGKIKSDKFQAQFNKLKGLTGVNTREGKCTITWIASLCQADCKPLNSSHTIKAVMKKEAELLTQQTHMPMVNSNLISTG